MVSEAREKKQPEVEGLDEKGKKLDEDGSIKSDEDSGNDLFEEWGSKVAGKNKESVYEFI